MQQRETSMRIAIGRCWRESCRRLRLAAAAAGGSKDHVARMCLFSGHDSTLMPLMMSLLPEWGRLDAGQQPTFPNQRTDWPPFCADLAIDLWVSESSAEPFVRALYCGEVVMHAEADERGFCPLDHWERMLAPLTAADPDGDGKTPKL